MMQELAGGDRRSIGKADQVVARVFQTPALLDEVIRGIGHDDAVIRMRCADVAEKVSAARPEWLQRYKRNLLAWAAKFRDKEVRWHMAQMLPRLQLSPSEREMVIELLLEYLHDDSQIVKTFSMQALFDMSVTDASLEATMVPILQNAVETGRGATLSRAKKLLKKIR